MPNEEFEKLILEKNPTAVVAITEDDEYIVPRLQHKWEGYQLRQPEIDALKANIRTVSEASHRTALYAEMLEKQNTTLTAEVERLRADAERYQHALEEVYCAEREYDPDLDRDTFFAELRAIQDAAIKETK